MEQTTPDKSGKTMMILILVISILTFLISTISLIVGIWPDGDRGRMMLRADAIGTQELTANTNRPMQGGNQIGNKMGNNRPQFRRQQQLQAPLNTTVTPQAPQQ